jgi:hypothetical protein
VTGVTQDRRNKKASGREKAPRQRASRLPHLNLDAIPAKIRCRSRRTIHESASVVVHELEIRPMPNPLRKEINDAVVRYLEGKLLAGEGVDVAVVAREMTQSLVDILWSNRTSIKRHFSPK